MKEKEDEREETFAGSRNCFRFAHPAEAAWRLEVAKPAGQYLGSILFWKSGSQEPRNRMEGNGNGME